MNQINRGDRVSFNTRKGKRTGTVAKIRVKRARGRRKQLAEMFGRPGEFDHTVAEVADDVGGGYWTVPVGSLSLLGKASREEFHKAHEQIQGVKDNHTVAKHRRQNKHYDQAKENGLLNLRLGQEIWVQFKHGWEMGCTFDGWVAGSGNVRFLLRGRKLTCSPKFVRLPRPLTQVQT